jgi:D-alanine-D-alanine ligase
LPPVEIIPPKENRFFDFDAKYSGKSQEICPGRFTREVKEQLEHAAKTAHHTLGLRHYSRSDFIVTPKGSVYILETNSLPGLTPESLLPKSLNAVGSNLGEFASHIVRIAQYS